MRRRHPHDIPCSRKAFEDAKEAIEQGSFGRLTEPYKSLYPDEKMLLDQVRHYRNWVAHGRRDRPANNTTPEAAFATLSKFWELLNVDGPLRPNITQEPAWSAVVIFALILFMSLCHYVFGQPAQAFECVFMRESRPA